MWLVVRNDLTRVAKSTESELAWLDNFLGFPDPTARFRRGGKEGRRAMLNPVTLAFPTGMLPIVQVEGPKAGHIVEVLRDERVKPCGPDASAAHDVDWLMDFQDAAVEVAVEKCRGVFHVPTGGGKCLAPETPVLLRSGEVIEAWLIVKGDVLVGPDNRPRTVLGTARGRGPLYRIIPNKGDSWVCNDVHVLTLVDNVTGKVEDVPLDVYLRRSAAWKHTRKLFQPAGGVDFDDVCELPINPYFVGVWYGDGRKDLAQGVQVSKPDAEIEAVCRDVAAQFGLEVRVDKYGTCPTYRIVGSKGRANPLLDLMRETVAPDHLPIDYLRASRRDRAALLAGLLDTDGHLHNGTYYELVQKQKGVAEGACFLARSLGMRATCRPKVVNGQVYWRANILGDATLLPLRIARKRPGSKRSGKGVKDALRVGFRVEAIGDGAYVGFELDGDGRFLLGDFTVTHNTEIGAALVSILPCEWAIFVASKSLVNEWVDRIAMRIGVTAGVIGDGMFSPGRVTVAMFQSVHRALAANDSRMKKWVESVQGFVVDECHLVAADTLWTVAMACRNAYYRFGNSATPFARGDRRGVLVVAAIGPTIYRIEQPTLVAQGTIAKGKVHLVHYALDEARAQELREMGASYGDAYESLVASNAHRDAAIVRVVRKAPKPAFVFVRLVDHGKALTDRLNDAGISAEFVWGEKHVKVREAAVRRLEHGDTDVIVCNVVFQAGVNVPTLASVVNVAGGKSHIAALQQTGRGSRRMDRDGQVVKDAFDVFDISDVNCGCKRPDPTQKGKSKWRHRACQWLERHARARRKAYLGEGYEVVEEDLA